MWGGETLWGRSHLFRKRTYCLQVVRTNNGSEVYRGNRIWGRGAKTSNLRGVQAIFLQQTYGIAGNNLGALISGADLG